MLCYACNVKPPRLALCYPVPMSGSSYTAVRSLDADIGGACRHGGEFMAYNGDSNRTVMWVTVQLGKIEFQ